MQAAVNNYFKKLERDLKTKEKTHLISTEYLFINEQEYIANYLNYIRDFVAKVKVYAFVRNPVDYFRSAQQQMIKGRSYIDNPKVWKNKFRSVIKAWSALCDIEIIEYKKQEDSCKTFCKKAGINYSKLSRPDKKSNISLSVEQMVLLEKIQSQLDKKHENKFKNHLGVINQVNAPFTTKPKLQNWVKPVIYNNHWEDLEWLKEEFGIDFLQNHPSMDMLSDLPIFENGKATVRDVYKILDENSIEKYEALVVDALLKKVIQ